MFLAAVCQDIGWCKNPEKHVEKSGVPMTGGWGWSKTHQKGSKVEGATVDGRNPAPVEVEVGSLSHYLQGFIHPRWCRDFFHQQYHQFPFTISY